MRLHPLTTLLVVLGLAVLLAAPADAAKARKHRLHASAAPDAARVVHDPNSVWYGNEYLGTDPDPRIRYELRRDLGAHFGGNF
jgi:hypothetical protein